MTALFRQSLIGAALSLALPLAAQTAPRPVRASDLLKIKAVSDPQLSPDGAWVAYTVTTIDSAKDKSDADLWMTSWDGKETIHLTSTPERESTPRWSPDGRYLAFLSGRQESKGAQVWLLDRRGGEAQRLTMIKDGVSSMEWSPDGQKLALVADLDPDTAKKDTTKKRPIEITRYAFKRDVEGYLTPSRSHILLFDVASKKLDTLTKGMEDDEQPRWSPDGKRIAFIRSPAPEPGVGEGSDVFVLDVASPGTPRNLTNLPGPRPRSAGVEPRRRMDRLPAHRRAQVVRLPARQARHREERWQRGAAACSPPRSTARCRIRCSPPTARA